MSFVLTLYAAHLVMACDNIQASEAREVHKRNQTRVSLLYTIH